jgi:hypothetical protein
MGFRTVVVLNNDMSQQWEDDPELGRKIFMAASRKQFGGADKFEDRFEYGETIEQVHADTQTVAFLDGYGGDAVAWTHWSRGETEEQKNLKMLKELARKMGYRVSKLPEKKG